MGNAILGGKETADDLGYGPARLLTSKLVREVAGALEAISEGELAARFDLGGLPAAHVYPVRDASQLEFGSTLFEHLSRC